MPGIRSSRNSGDVAGRSADEQRDLNRFAMSAEKESYATQQNLSPVKIREIKKTGGAPDFQQAPARDDVRKIAGLAAVRRLVFRGCLRPLALLLLFLLQLLLLLPVFLLELLELLLLSLVDLLLFLIDLL